MRLVYVVREKKGGAVLIGNYGTGKTTLANTLLEEFSDTNNYSFVFIANPLLGPLEFLKEIICQLGVEFSHDIDRLEVKQLLENTLLKNMEESNHVVVIIDEAHLIQNKETWEELRLLLNIQFNNRFLLSVILIGQLELSNIINEYKQFKQRLAIRCYLNPLTEKETGGYINYRLKVAGYDGAIFSEEATKSIFFYSKGNPREINNVCDMSLLVGYGRKTDRIGKDIVEEVIEDLERVV
ncbi:MAG: AAA family ATPase [Candidatus Omnitrophica bacterium]|nr:AAA family ATPase [Candidatus Omnitrophota bacterium]